MALRVFLSATRLQFLLAFRDRRTLLLMILIPLALTLTSISQMRKHLASEATTTPRVAVRADVEPHLMDQILMRLRTLGLHPTTSTSPQTDVERGRAAAGIHLTNGQAGKAIAHLHVRAGDTSSMAMAVPLATLLVEAQTQDHPLRVTSTVFIVGESGALQESLLLMFLTLVSVIPGLGAMQVAGDLGAGEKERKTLEVVLATPIPSSFLAGAKYVAILSISLISCSLALTAQFLGLAWLQGTGSFPIPSLSTLLLPVLALVISVCTVISGISLVISLSARTMREAMILMVPVQIGFMALAFWISKSAPTATDPLLLAAPVANVVLITKQMVMQDPIEGWQVLVAVTTTGLTGGALCLLAGWLLKKESMVHA